jgi:hypothetical protein
MLDYRKACAYVAAHQKELLKEAEIARLLNRRSPRNISARLIIWTGDLLIAAGMRLKSTYKVDSSPNIKTANYTQ